MKFILSIVLLISGYLVNAQEYEKLPDKYQKKLARIKNEEKRLKRYNKYLKRDSSGWHKRAKHELKEPGQELAEEHSDLPVHHTPDSAAVVQEGVRILNDSLNQYGISVPQLDSTQIQHARDKTIDIAADELHDQLGVEINDLAVDSTLTDQVKSELNAELNALTTDELGLEVSQVQLDSAGRAQIAKKLERRAEEELKNVDGFDQLGDTGELGKLEEYKGQLEQTRQQAQQSLAKQQMKEKMAAQAKEYISKNADKLQQVQSQMGELKKKYSYVPNSNDLSTAKKRTSLADEPLGKRLVFGGNFNVSETNPVAIDLSPTVSYRFNTLFEMGASGMYRAEFNASRSGVASEDGATYGYSLFVSHMVFKNFFGYLEGENISRVKQVQDQPEREWDQTFLLGIGRRFAIAKWLEMQAIVTYNFLHENRDGVYNSPLVFKTGIRFKK